MPQAYFQEERTKLVAEWVRIKKGTYTCSYCRELLDFDTYTARCPHCGKRISWGNIRESLWKEAHDAQSSIDEFYKKAPPDVSYWPDENIDSGIAGCLGGLIGYALVAAAIALIVWWSTHASNSSTSRKGERPLGENVASITVRGREISVGDSPTVLFQALQSQDTVKEPTVDSNAAAGELYRATYHLKVEGQRFDLVISQEQHANGRLKIEAIRK